MTLGGFGSALCPDEEGIKTTMPASRHAKEKVQHSALTKKGLRPQHRLGLAAPRRVQHSALTKKGLRLRGDNNDPRWVWFSTLP